MAKASTAELKGFAPMPPKICLPMKIATKVPVITSHQGLLAGRSMPKMMPIVAA